MNKSTIFIVLLASLLIAGCNTTREPGSVQPISMTGSPGFYLDQWHADLIRYLASNTNWGDPIRSYTTLDGQYVGIASGAIMPIEKVNASFGDPVRFKTEEFKVAYARQLEEYADYLDASDREKVVTIVEMARPTDAAEDLQELASRGTFPVFPIYMVAEYNVDGRQITMLYQWITTMNIIRPDRGYWSGRAMYIR